LLTLLIFIIVLGVLVLVHEFGHFILAKRLGMRVEEFGFGFPPRIFGVKFGETLYSFNLIPLGGFVRIYGEDGKDADSHLSFAGQSALNKTLVIMAGISMNLVLAVVLLFFANYLGLRVGISPDTSAVARDIKVQIFQVSSDSPAHAAGLMLLDEIVRMESKEEIFFPKTVGGVQNFVAEHKGEEIILGIRRSEEELSMAIVPRVEPPAGEGPLGISLDATGIVNYPWYQALGRAFLMTYNLVLAVIFGLVEFFRLLFFEFELSEDVAGPVGIYFLTSRFVSLGLGTFLAFMAQISVALAVLNTLPLVPLDGGRQLLILIEKIKGRAVSIKTQNILALVGWALLGTLIFFVTKQDITRFF